MWFQGLQYQIDQEEYRHGLPVTADRLLVSIDDLSRNFRVSVSIGRNVLLVQRLRIVGVSGVDGLNDPNNRLAW